MTYGNSPKNASLIQPERTQPNTCGEEKENMLLLTNRLKMNCDDSIESIHALLETMGIRSDTPTQGKVPTESKLCFIETWRGLSEWLDVKSREIEQIISISDDAIYGVIGCKSAKEAVGAKEVNYIDKLYNSLLNFEYAVGRIADFTRTLNKDIHDPSDCKIEAGNHVDKSFNGLWKSIPVILATNKGIIDSCRTNMYDIFNTVSNMENPTTQPVEIPKSKLYSKG